MAAPNRIVAFPDCPALTPDGLEKHAEVDGIVCLTSLAGKSSAADRLRALLADAYGEEWSATKLAELLGGSASLEDWLRDGFFEEHCQIFHQRPFIWHVWDGRKDGFHALVNYHKLDHKMLEKLIYSYLGDWISRQRQDLVSGVEGADGRLAAAEHLQGELKKILDGEKPYDVFVRWKSLKEQPLGWNPDLNDGVCVNIRPWITEAHLYRATKPGILRVTPNIKYGKDRGKEPARDPKEFPWFKDSTERNNDIHLSLERKTARTRAGMKLLDRIRESLAKVLRVPEGQAAPVAIIWTDATGEWLSLAPMMRELIPEFYTLGAFRPKERTGPAIWLKCIVDRTLPEAPAGWSRPHSLPTPRQPPSASRCCRLSGPTDSTHRVAVPWPGLGIQGSRLDRDGLPDVCRRSGPRHRARPAHGGGTRASTAALG